MSKERVYNFAAGPSALPLEVLEQAAGEMMNYNGSGMSVMEMSHRGKDFKSIIETAEQDLRDLMHIPNNYKVLFLQGGGSTQFSMVPLNLFRKSRKADYVVTGSWAKKAAAEAKKYGEVNVVATSADKNFSYIPQLDPAQFTKDADYFYICYNNTIYGTRFTSLPDTGSVPLVGDLSSMILSEEVDVTKFGLIFAGAQKNVAPSGVTIAIIRDDLLGFYPEATMPTMLNYQIHSDNGSMYNTPPCYPIYLAGLTLKWIKRLGGVSAIQKINEEKAALLYGAVDGSDLFQGTAAVKDRSLMNVDFVTGDADLDKRFIEEAKKVGLVNINGHRSVGGMRASLYNAVTLDATQALVSFMKEFESKNK